MDSLVEDVPVPWARRWPAPYPLMDRVSWLPADHTGVAARLATRRGYRWQVSPAPGGGEDADLSWSEVSCLLDADEADGVACELRWGQIVAAPDRCGVVWLPVTDSMHEMGVPRLPLVPVRVRQPGPKDRPRAGRWASEGQFGTVTWVALSGMASPVGGKIDVPVEVSLWRASRLRWASRALLVLAAAIAVVAAMTVTMAGVAWQTGWSWWCVAFTLAMATWAMPKALLAGDPVDQHGCAAAWALAAAGDTLTRRELRVLLDNDSSPEQVEQMLADIRRGEGTVA